MVSLYHFDSPVSSKKEVIVTFLLPYFLHEIVLFLHPFKNVCLLKKFSVSSSSSSSSFFFLLEKDC